MAITQTPETLSSQETRLLARQNTITNTAGYSGNNLQANLLILPEKHSQDFHNLCLRNPVSCPLLGISSIPGNPHKITPTPCIQNRDFDIRTDCPSYRVYKHGKCIAANKPDLLDLWSTDDPNAENYTAFLLGCSFSFEAALCNATPPLTPRHQLSNTIVSMYRTSLPLLPAGIFTNATCIVSMRPYHESEVERVRDITRPYLATHGEPVDWGWDAVKRLGIRNIHDPDFGEKIEFKDGEVPVFWACGVTPQMAIEAAGDKIDGLVFAHEPGNMLVTDWVVEDLERLKEGIAAFQGWMN
ncbi:UPF0317 protein C5H10.01 [Aspergillus awamori]|uniref:DUF1445-domain-containing protein n=5 Tax=Aspergillus TaxID=5052 RepID=A0A3F3PQQ9_9EURO|nr:hypothetical protein BDQ94DRAFT_150848 [Aspergillus welwitschiae]EHA21695.1 hypothetical protein ASPNIDRAFT_210777 [Aspergillus niger ATCC 1015]KAI2897828.1 hypothetical protein CBS11852_3839 [Aspergillus niger]GCB25376.1 UPF0317 protein C5H10.01 [Aspergillus awamori]KAI2911316.1 hypothetical protein CBS63078_3962 [Aspergillus niger]KAI2941399.1 hypothetical protein CBS147321_5838 [Aspergillus niger]